MQTSHIFPLDIFVIVQCIQKTKTLASSPITSWQIDGETVERVADFIFVGSKITADGDCSHEIKRRLLLGRKVMSKAQRRVIRWIFYRRLPPVPSVSSPL